MVVVGESGETGGRAGVATGDPPHGQRPQVEEAGVVRLLQTQEVQQEEGCIARRW